MSWGGVLEKQYKWVAEATSSNRLDDVSFSHHREAIKKGAKAPGDYFTLFFVARFTMNIGSSSPARSM